MAEKKETRDLVEGTLKNGTKVRGELVERDGKVMVVLKSGGRRPVSDFRAFTRLSFA